MTSLTPNRENRRSRNSLASWRSGYAADCKSVDFPRQINDIPHIGYQDIARTKRETDNATSSNAGAR